MPPRQAPTQSGRSPHPIAVARRAVGAALLAALVGSPPNGAAVAAGLPAPGPGPAGVTAPDPAPASARRPVVLVPGATGSTLLEADSGRTLWGEGRHLLAPRDRGYAIARPLTGADDRIVPGEVIEEIRLSSLVRKPIYGPIIRLLEGAGYRRGELDRPRSEDTLFLFAYDWRRSSVESARQLAERLEAVRRARGVERLEVDLVCQSNGGLVCRYLAKYGGLTLEQAAGGRTPRPQAVSVRRLALIGTSSGGSLRILRELDRGRRYVPGVGRHFAPEVLFTFASLFEDLPVYRRDLFVDRRGRPLRVRLHDPASWVRHRWSIFAPTASARVARSGRDDLFGDPRTRRRYLADSLARALELHRLLAEDVAGFTTRYDSIQNLSKPTPDRAVLTRSVDGRPALFFTGDRWLGRRPALDRRVTTLGDGHAAVASQRWLSPGERRALVAEPLAVAGSHFELILADATRARLVAFLTAEPERADGADAPGRVRSDNPE